MRTASRIIHLPVLVMLSASPTASPAEEPASPPKGMPFKQGLGYELFQDNCAQCHGADLEGTDEGPPLLHGYYKPGHHADAAFHRAIQQGSQQHHWNFGDMPPVEGVDDTEAQAIIDFVRWYQQDAGLY